MSAYTRYLVYVLRHKWYVFLAGNRVGASLWRLLVHDWTKFSRAEFGAYAQFFYGETPTTGELRRMYGERPNDDANLRDWKAERRAAFDAAWLHHQKANDHHWQYWVLMEDDPRHNGRRFLIQSHDCMTDFGVVEHPHGMYEVGHSVMLGGCAITDPHGDATISFAQRVVDAANRYRALPMPAACVREMVADWMGAGRAITGRWEVREWYVKNRDKMVLHPDTRAAVEALLSHPRTRVEHVEAA